jgi:hypothetical protein
MFKKFKLAGKEVVYEEEVTALTRMVEEYKPM